MTGRVLRLEDRGQSTPTSRQEPPMSEKPISPLRRRMTEDMSVRKFGVVFGSRSQGSRLRGDSRYPMSEGSVLRSCLDPPQRSVRTSAADLRSNRPGTDYRVDPL